MPNHELNEMAKRFSDYHNATIATQEPTMRKVSLKATKTKATKPMLDTPTKISRKDQVINLMKRTHGVTTAQITELTGMLEHSARALISGIAKTEMVDRSKAAGEATVYRILRLPAPVKKKRKAKA